MSVRALIYDFDGVILESADIKTHAFARLFEEHEEHVEEIVQLHLRLAGVSRYEKFKLIYADILGRPLDDDGLAQLGEDFSAICLQEVLSCPFVPGAREFLEARAESHLQFVASGTPEQELRHIVEQRGIAPVFRGVYGTPDTKGVIARRILDEYGLETHEAVFLGDATTDLDGAREAGIPFIGRVRPGDPDPFADDPSIPVVEDLGQLDRDWEAITERLLATAQRG